MKQYLEMLEYVMKHGKVREDRTGVGTKSVFGYQMRFDLSEGFPLVTTKKTHLKAVVSELLWFLEGSTDERRLAEIHYGKDRSNLIENKTIWTANADNQGKKLGYINNDLVKELGHVYGEQWRSWEDSNGETIDQIREVIEQIENNPYSRRHIVSAWNVSDIEKMALPPCHTMFQFYVEDYTKEEIHNKFILPILQSNFLSEKDKEFIEMYDEIEDREEIDWEYWYKELGIKTKKLSCQLYQRSADAFLGVPFNIASYALLTKMIAEITNLDVGDFVHTFGDLHIYTNHMEQVEEQLKRKPLKLPELFFARDIKDIDDFRMEDFILEDYQCHEAIKAEMAV